MVHTAEFPALVDETGSTRPAIDEIRHSLGDVACREGWSGLESAPGAGPEGGDAAKLALPGYAEFRYRAEEGDGIEWDAGKGRFRRFDPAGDWWDWQTLALDVKLPADLRAVDLSLSVLTPDDVDEGVRQSVDVRVSGDGWQTISVPVDDFRLNEAVKPTYLNYVHGLGVEVTPVDSERAGLLIDDVRIQRGNPVAVDTPVQSKPGEPGETIEYDVTVSNCSDEPRAVSLRMERDGGEVIVTEVEPGQVQLDPGETEPVTVRAEIPTHDDPGFQGELPEGGRERWRLKAVPDGRADLADTVELIHVARMESPYIVHTDDEWDEIRELAETVDWARETADEHVSFARAYEPPATNGPAAESLYDSKGPSQDLWRVAVAWQLTREEAFAEKVAEFFRVFTDPERGYLALPSASGEGGLVHEGIMFRNLARSYDTVRDSGVFTPEDEERIEAAFRLYMAYLSRNLDGVGNHPLSGVSGALQCALALQDWERAEWFLDGPYGVEWQIRRGIMDDGWTVEVSTGYNMFCARMFTKAGLALRRWGVEILEERFPAVYHESNDAGAHPGEAAEPWSEPEAGMYGAAWGPSHNNYRSVRDMWDSIIPLVNEDEKLVGLNDSHGENDVDSYDVAAYAYGDKKYVRLSSGQNLVYPVDRSDVDDADAEELLPNYRADNAGLGLLRSQGADSPSEQYQAGLKYGSHGLHHGHWDRLNLVYLRRFGKLATHTRTAWFSYKNIMYQMYVQTSMAHSMVVVDGKNQYPAPSDRLLWHTGDLFQAIAVENESRWSNPRFRSDRASEGELEAGVMEHAGHEVPIPEDPPEPGHMTEFTEPIRSRRAVAVTDDYVLVVDHVAGEADHRFDALYQFRGFEAFDADADIEFREERDWFDDSPLRAGQFVSDVQVYESEGPVRATFVSGYEPGDPEPRPEVEEGMETMTIDVHSVWPPEREQVVATNPQDWNTYSAARTRGREAAFVTLVELQEDPEHRQVSAVTAAGPDDVRVELADGRVHQWAVDGLNADGNRPDVDLSLTEDGPDGSHREETTD